MPVIWLEYEPAWAFATNKKDLETDAEQTEQEQNDENEETDEIAEDGGNFPDSFISSIKKMKYFQAREKGKIKVNLWRRLR